MDAERDAIDKLMEDLQKKEFVIFTPQQIELILSRTYLNVCGLAGVFCDSGDKEEI